MKTHNQLIEEGIESMMGEICPCNWLTTENGKEHIKRNCPHYTFIEEQNNLRTFAQSLIKETKCWTNDEVQDSIATAIKAERTKIFGVIERMEKTKEAILDSEKEIVKRDNWFYNKALTDLQAHLTKEL